MAHEHDCCSEGCAGSSLRQFIDTGAAYALNCRRGRNVSAIVDRDWGSKAERDGIEPLETPADEDDSELLLHLPFTHDVSISGILLSTDCDGTCPKQLRAFTNKEVDLDSAASSSATQAWDVACDPGALVEHLTRRSRFARVSSVTLHVPSSHNESTTRIWWIGIRGVGGQTNRNAIADAVYEVQPQSNVEVYLNQQSIGHQTR